MRYFCKVHVPGRNGYGVKFEATFSKEPDEDEIIEHAVAEGKIDLHEADIASGEVIDEDEYRETSG